ncbi:unnamed protein product [Amoebophrya sp. A25]|nr:unnamed protein product [Amoebophrya sp. A25]|eukprot:GSA25T00012707001.1
MTEVLWDWCRDYAGVNVESEREFANGYKIAELLATHNQQLEFPAKFRDTDLIDDQINNFAELQPSLKNLGIKFLPSDAEAIMGNKRGAALRLLYQIKMVIDRIAMTQRPSLPASQHSDNLIIRDPKLLARSFRLPKPSADAEESRFFVNRLRAQCAHATLQRREARYNKFEREKLSQQMLAQEMDKVDAEKALEDRETHRKVCLDMMKRNKTFLDQWNEQGVMDWKTNLARQRQRENLEKSYRTRLVQRQRKNVRGLKDAKTLEVTQGIDDFERNLRKYTSGEKAEDVDADLAATLQQSANADQYFSEEEDDDTTAGGDGLVRRTTRAETVKDLFAALNSKVPGPEILLKDAEEFLGKIKDSKIAGNLARKEREQRRRRFLVDLAQEHEGVAEQYLREHLMQQLTKPCVEEERINYLVWKTSQYESVMRESRRQRMKDYDAQRKLDTQVEKRRDLELRDLQIDELFGTTQVSDAKAYRALERGRVARRRAYHVSLVENIVTDAMVELMNLADAQQELTDKGRVDGRVWKSWMDSFIAGEPLEELYAGDASISDKRPYQIGPYDDSHKLDFESADLLEGAFKSYLLCTDQWQVSKDTLALVDAPAGEEEGPSEEAWKAVMSAEELEALPEEYKSKLSAAPEVTRGQHTNFRMAAVVNGIVSQLYPEPQQIVPPADPLPSVPLRLVLAGKPMCGKKTLARKLADEFGLEVLDPTSVLKQAMNLAGRPQEGTLDALHANAHVPPDISGDPYLLALKDCGARAVAIVDEGEVVPPELYVEMIICKLKSLEKSMTTGWCLCEFPITLHEMRLFEKALCGYIEPSQREIPDAVQRKKVVEYLIPEAERPPEPYVPEVGGYDLYVLLEASCEAVVLRSAGRRVDLTTTTVYNIAEDQQKKPQDVKYENLRALDMREKAQGTFCERMHFFDVHQIQTLKFLELFAPMPDVPRVLLVSEDAPEHVFEVVRSKVQELLKFRRKADEAVREATPPTQTAEVAEPVAPVAAADEANADGTDEAAPAEAVAAPFEPYTLDMLKDLCAKLESRYLELLHSQWLEIQDSYVETSKLTLQRYEQHLRETSAGLSYLREKFITFLERKKPEKQTLLNEYVLDFNTWNTEYPHMILDPEPKAEFHLRLQAMRQQFADFRDAKREETETFIGDIRASLFIEGLINVVCVLAQQFVSVETERYHRTSQLLTDFYALAAGKNIPESRPMPEKIQIITPETAAEFSARVMVDTPASGAEGSAAEAEPTKVETFPFVEQLRTYADSVAWPIVETPEGEEGASLNPGAVDLAQALLSERVLFLSRVTQVQQWSSRRCKEISALEAELHQGFRDQLTAREFKEGEVEVVLLQKLHKAVEAHKPIEYRLIADTTQITEVQNERVLPEPEKVVVPKKVSGVRAEWDAEQLAEEVDAFFPKF